MTLTPNREVFVTCALTGAAETQDRSRHVPRSPAEIAADAEAAARAGAAIVHVHVRDPETGAPCRDPALFREVTERIRDSDVDMVLNLTCGSGGDLILPADAPLPPAEASDLAPVAERVAHILDCRPEIATLDCGSMNFADDDYVLVNTPSILRGLASAMKDAGVRPEIEAFDTGHLWLAKALAEEGVIETPALVQLCMGVRWGAPDDLATFNAMVAQVPQGWTFSAFGLGRHQMPYVAAAVLAGGNVRIGLEDNLWLRKGELATNAALTERAVTLIETMGSRVLSPAEVRERLRLTKQAPQ